ncbi:hypothetical protein EYF80_067060 [Liparis tanakae]|uniref:Uncharacterized protein n=1 Tax=Liparis tanakae TaxID=230148 RepID=A0A4Z2E2E6_9TELE|nr:hypothetical protein EYF80_067060 [Liparis tanakae]
MSTADWTVWPAHGWTVRQWIPEGINSSFQKLETLEQKKTFRHRAERCGAAAGILRGRASDSDVQESVYKHD